jgi:HSP20 family protein
MDPTDPEDRDRRKRSPFDFNKDDDFFKDIFNDDKLMDDIRKMAEEMMKVMGNAQPGKSVVHGFKVQFGPDGKPHIEDFGNKQTRSPEGDIEVSDEIEPLTDIIEEKDTVSITVEIPGVNRENIDLTATDDALEITVDSPKRRYHKIIDLPCHVKTKSTRATYKNGILDIVLDKKEKKKDSSGYRVSIE